MPLAELKRQPRSPLQLRAVQNQGCVRVQDILLGPNAVRRGLGFPQLIAVRDTPVFCATSLWAPTAVRDSTRDRGIQRGPVDSRLPAGDDLGNRDGGGHDEGTLRATRSLALRLRGFDAISASEARCGFLVTTSKRASSRKASFTRRSSSE